MFHLGCDKSLLDCNSICFTLNRSEGNTSFGCKCPGAMKKVKDILLSVLLEEGETMNSTTVSASVRMEWLS
uniref:Uncharacterized protein n=1 Tax=Arundo donax TaxID=35708 RepID=A0A0A8ZN58_ARUDO